MGVQAVTETPASELGRSYDCKTPHCTGEARSPVGRYSYCDLCREHREKTLARPDTNGAAPAASLRGVVAPPTVPGGLEEKVKQLGKLGREADRLAAIATRKLREAQEAEQRAQQKRGEFRRLARSLYAEES